MLLVVAIVLALALILVGPFVAFTPRGPKPPASVGSIADLETYLTALTAAETPPAIGVTVVKDGNLVYAKAFGKKDAGGNPVGTDHVFHFWSVTKLFTATAVMQLADEGKVDLDAPVARYLAGFRTTGPSGTPAAITVRQLVNHTSGMKDLRLVDLVGWIHRSDDRTASETDTVAERMARYARLAYEPGKVGSYSNAGYIVLGALIEAVTGQPYPDVIRQKILDPLGMASTDFVYRPDLTSRAVAGTHPLFHIFTPLLLLIHNDWFSSFVETTTRGRMWLRPLCTDYSAPTGLLGTGEDLAKFGQAFLDPRPGDRPSILRSETAKAMLDDGYGGHTGPDGDRMGLGWHWWDAEPMPFKGHGGFGPGFAAQLALFPVEKLVVVILANDTLTGRLQLTRLVAAAFK